MTSPSASIKARRPPAGVHVVDFHAHLGPFPAFFIPDPDPGSMLRVMDRCAIRTTCLSSHRAIAADAEGGNVETAAAVRRYPGRFLGYLTVNPHQRPEHLLERFVDDPAFVGIKLHPDLHRYPVSGERYGPAFELAAERGWPVLVHAFDGSPYDDPACFDVVAERHPRTQIVVGHAGATPSGFARSVALARAHDNVHLEISGSWMTGLHLEQMVDAIGSDRILFGTDQPFIDPRYSLGRVVFATLPEEVVLAILGANARRLLGADALDVAAGTGAPVTAVRDARETA